MTLKQLIIDESKRLGIDKIGFASAAPFTELQASLEEQKRLNHHSGFEHSDIEERIYPERTFENPQSIIVIALAYPVKGPQKPLNGEKRGQFARASWGIDYHDILRKKLNQLIEFIQRQAGSAYQKQNWHFKPQVDTGELVDVAAAQRAGLGFIGRNGLLITKEYGSFVYLGEIITNIIFETDLSGKFDCGDCVRCITACPTKALLGDGRMNAQKCLSYQTQTKEIMPLEFRKKMRNMIYGCDICQLVCPYNKGKDFHLHPKMEPKLDEAYPKLKPLLSIKNKDFKVKFGHLAGSWRGKKTLQRNAIIALANLGDRSALPDLMNCLGDVRPVIRGTAAWAVGQLGNKHPEIYIDLLYSFQEKETEEEVLLEISMAINHLKKSNLD